MTTGYVVSGRGDLDGLFMARSAAAIANTGFKSNGGVDLAQRFEPRGGATAIADTGFKAGASDLAQLFRDITLVAPSNHTMLSAGLGATNKGFSNGAVVVAGGTFSPGTYLTWTVGHMYSVGTGALVFRLSGASVPNDLDSVWQRLVIFGNFDDTPGTVTRTVFRSARTAYSPGVNSAEWTLPSVNGFELSNVFSVQIFRI